MNALLWHRVQDLCDERRDPLDDPAVVTLLDRDPEALAEVATLRAVLAGIPAAAPRRRPYRRVAGVLGAALVLTGAVFLAWGRGGAPARIGDPVEPRFVRVRWGDGARESSAAGHVTVHRPHHDGPDVVHRLILSVDTPFAPSP